MSEVGYALILVSAVFVGTTVVAYAQPHYPAFFCGVPVPIPSEAQLAHKDRTLRVLPARCEGAWRDTEAVTAEKLRQAHRAAVYFHADQRPPPSGLRVALKVRAGDGLS